MDHVGKVVRRLREERGLNQAQLAVSVGTGPSAISQIENGKRSPNSETLVKLARALEVEMADLFPKAQTPLFARLPTKPPSEGAEEWKGPIPNSLKEALEWVNAPTQLMSLPPQEFEELYTNLTREEVIELNKNLSREQELLRPLLWQWRTMPQSKERTRLCALWRESLVRTLTGAAAAEKAGDMETAQELAGVA